MISCHASPCMWPAGNGLFLIIPLKSLSILLVYPSVSTLIWLAKIVAHLNGGRGRGNRREGGARGGREGQEEGGRGKRREGGARGGRGRGNKREGGARGGRGRGNRREGQEKGGERGIGGREGQEEGGEGGIGGGRGKRREGKGE